MSNTAPKPFVFVLMPFQKEFDDVYKLGIKVACDNAGAYAERVDEQLFQDSILQRVYNQIAKADIIVADMTGRNPNVFYEAGYAHALGKHVILLTQNTDDIPFDLKHYPHIIYEGRIADLIPELQKRVKWAIDNPEEPSDSQQPPIEFCIDSMPIHKNPTIEIDLGDYSGTSNASFKFSVHNQDNVRIQTASFKIAILTTESFSYSEVYFPTGEEYYPDDIHLPKGGIIHTLNKFFAILPGARESFRWKLNTAKGRTLRAGDEEQVILRMFSEHGGYDYPFKIAVVEKKSNS